MANAITRMRSVASIAGSISSRSAFSNQGLFASGELESRDAVVFEPRREGLLPSRSGGGATCWGMSRSSSPPGSRGIPAAA